MREYKKPDPACRFCKGEADCCTVCGAFDLPEWRWERERAALTDARDRYRAALEAIAAGSCSPEGQYDAGCEMQCVDIARRALAGSDKGDG